MRTYWFEILLITVLFSLAFSVTLGHADDSTTVTPDAQQLATGQADVLQSGNLSIATSPFGSTIVIKPLDAPGNPYGNSYTDVDRMVYQNLDPRFTTLDNLRSDLRLNFGRGIVLQGDNRTPNQVNGIETITNTSPSLPDFNNRVRVLIDQYGYMVPQSDPRSGLDMLAGPLTIVQVGPGRYSMANAGILLGQPGGYLSLESGMNASDSGGITVDTSDTAVSGIPEDAQADASSPTTSGVQSGSSNPEAAGTQPTALKGETRVNGQPGMDASLPAEPYYAYTSPLPAEKMGQIRKIRTSQAVIALPRIPEWVAKTDADRLLLLPNGSIEIDPLDNAGTTVIYSPEGDRLGEVQDIRDWREFFDKNYDSLVKEAATKGWDIIEHDGYLLLRDSDTRQVRAIYDWDGKPVALGTELKSRPYYFTPLLWNNVQTLYERPQIVPAAGR